MGARVIHHAGMKEERRGFTDEDIVPETVTEELQLQEAVPNRTRRAIFVFGTWMLCWAIAAYLSIMKTEGKIAELVVDGCTSYMIVIAITYITSHSIDRSHVITRVMDMVEKRKGV